MISESVEACDSTEPSQSFPELWARYICGCNELLVHTIGVIKDVKCANRLSQKYLHGNVGLCTFSPQQQERKAFLR